MGDTWSAADFIGGLVGQADGGSSYSTGDLWTVAISIGGIVVAALAALAVMAWRLGNRYADRTDGRLDRQSRRQERLEGRFDSGLKELTFTNDKTAEIAQGPQPTTHSRLANLKLSDSR